MLADPRRVRLILAGGFILLAATVLRLASGDGIEHPQVPIADDPDTSAVATEPEDDEAPQASQQQRGEPAANEPGEDSIEVAHQVAAAFADDYLTWPPDEEHPDRVERIAAHTTSDFAQAIAGAQARGAADGAGGWSQVVEILDTQTQTVRSRSIEVTVMTEITTVEEDREATTLSNVTVVTRPEGGTWLVDDLR